MSGLGGPVRWQPFPKGWTKYFREQTGKRFAWETVNAQCSAVAELYRNFYVSHATDLRAALGRAREVEHQYGFYLGSVTHPYWVRYPLIRHAWVRVGAEIHDPTRFCFYATQRSYVAIVLASDPAYDLGMNRVKQALGGRPMPAYDPSKRVDCTEPVILNIFDGAVDEERLIWLANCPPGHPVFCNEAHRRAVVRWFVEAGHGVWVPIDNRKGITV